MSLAPSGAHWFVAGRVDFLTQEPQRFFAPLRVATTIMNQHLEPLPMNPAADQSGVHCWGSRETTIDNPTDYRQEARKFVEQAQSAKNSEHRLLLLRKAQTMVRIAEQAEMMQRIVDNETATGTRSAPPS
jgi:hypothetical protein